MFHFLGIASFKVISCVAAQAQRAWGMLYQGVNFHGGDARKCFTSCFTTSNLQVSHQTWNVSHRKCSHDFTTSSHVSHYPVYPEISKTISSTVAKTELHEGRHMESVDLHAQVQAGCVATKGNRLCLENASG